jgi:hypothetical protein
MESMVYFSAGDGAAVHAITGKREMDWQVLTARGSMDPIADAAARSRHCIHPMHTFGRFRVARFESCELAVLVRHVDSPVYCLRLPL